MTVLVIGAAGFIGSAVARAAAAHDAVGDVALLVRRPEPGLEQYGKVFVGDARRVNLGLSAEAADELAATVTGIVVATGSFDVGLSLRQAQMDHIAPVRGAVAFARRCRSLESLVLVSSLLAVGVADGRLRSDDAIASPRHRNFYEWAKWETEALVRRSPLPWRIVRAGHVLNSVDGEQRTRRAGAVFEALPFLATGLPLPIVPEGVYWCCSADLVADVVLAAGLADRPHSSYWAVDPNAPRYSELLDVLAARHGMGGRRIGSRRFGRAMAAVVQPTWLGLSVGREVFDYCAAAWDLDLRCLEGLAAERGIGFPADRSYITDTIDHEVARFRAFA